MSTFKISACGISINLYQSVTEKTVITTEVVLICLSQFILEENGFSHQYFTSFFCLIISTIDTASLLMSFYPIIWLTCISPVAKTTTIATTTTGETCRITPSNTWAVQQVFFTYCWIHVNSYSGPQHNLWDLLQENSLLRQKVWPTLSCDCSLFSL